MSKLELWKGRIEYSLVNVRKVSWKAIHVENRLNKQYDCFERNHVIRLEANWMQQLTATAEKLVLQHHCQQLVKLLMQDIGDDNKLAAVF